MIIKDLFTIKSKICQDYISCFYNYCCDYYANHRTMFLKQSSNDFSYFFFIHLQSLTSLSILFIASSPPFQRTLFGSISDWMVFTPIVDILSWDKISLLNTWFHWPLDHISSHFLGSRLHFTTDFLSKGILKINVLGLHTCKRISLLPSH